MLKKILLLVCLIAIFGIGCFLMFNKDHISFEEAKKQISLTKTIVVRKLEMSSDKFTIYKNLTDADDIKKIVSILSNSSLVEEEWENIPGDTYQLEFLDEKGKLISEVSINFISSSKMKGKGYNYKFLSNDLDSLQKVIEG